MRKTSFLTRQEGSFTLGLHLIASLAIAFEKVYLQVAISCPPPDSYLLSSSAEVALAKVGLASPRVIGTSGQHGAHTPLFPSFAGNSPTWLPLLPLWDLSSAASYCKTACLSVSVPCSSSPLPLAWFRPHHLFLGL